MKKTIIGNLLILAGILLYDVLFWNEKLGLNTLIFTLFIVGSLFWLNRAAFHSKAVIITTVGTILTALLVVSHNSLFSKVFYFFSMITMVGLIQQHTLRFLWYGTLLSILGWFKTPIRFFIKLFEQVKRLSEVKPAFRLLRLAVLPFFVFLLFFWIYTQANPRFAAFTEYFFGLFEVFRFDFIFESIGRVVFLIVGIWGILAIFWKNSGNWLERLESLHPADLERNKVKAAFPNQFSMIDLRNEYRSGVLLVWSLNVLLFFVNLVDLKYIWLNFETRQPYELSSFVHEGTYILIFAIILAMSILVFLFRKNLNFYSLNKGLKLAAYIWILQNLLLTLSVGVRNWHYVAHYGLAYKRIGVFIFLTLTVFGLATMYLKIRDKKSFYYLCYNNSWAGYFLFIFLCFVNWDVEITRYNLQNTSKNGIDTRFLVYDVSYKNIILLEEHQDKLERQGISLYGETLKHEIEWKKQTALRKTKANSWASWNYTDYKISRYYLE